MSAAPLTTDPCGAESCPVAGGFYFFPPHLAGNAFLMAAFAMLVPFNLYLGVRHRTPLYTLFFITGLLLEIIGHLGRILLRDDLSSRAFFILYMVGTTTGPTFITAAIYIVLPHILAVYGDRYCVIPSPLWVGMIFFGLDVFTLTFQIVGCIFAVDGVSKPEMAQGVNILIAGMGLQIASLIAFFVAYCVFIFRLTRNHQWLDRKHASIYRSSRFKVFLLCLQISSAFILTRTITRIIQLAGGFESMLFQSTTINLVLDSIVILLACLILTLAAPAIAFGGKAWGETSPHKLGWSRGGFDHGDYALGYPGRNSPGSYYASRSQRSDRAPKPYEHQVPGHLQYPNLYKSSPRPIRVPPYDSAGSPANSPPLNSAGSQENSRKSKRLSPPQAGMVRDEALW